MSKGNTFENDLLKLIFNATAIANIADNAASSPITNLYVSLHTADPGEAGDQTTSEATYTGYARVAVPRTAGGWTVTANSVSPAAAIEFPAVTGGSEAITHWAVGIASSGASKILYSGTVTPNIAVSAGVTPRLTTGSTITED
ncbi:phage tail fiber protein [Sinorhizobium fredii]